MNDKLLRWLLIGSVAATLFGARQAFADITVPTGVYYKIGPLNLTVPFSEVDATYMYDVIANRNLVGGETPVGSLIFSKATLVGTLGAVTSLDGKGAPFIGGKIQLPNPAHQWAFLGNVQPGLFGGFDWVRGSAIAGFKADIPLW